MTHINLLYYTWNSTVSDTPSSDIVQPLTGLATALSAIRLAAPAYRNKSHGSAAAHTKNSLGKVITHEA